MEMVTVVQPLNVFLQLQGAIDNIAIQRQHLLRLQGIGRRVETTEIGKQETAGVTDTAIAVAHLLENVLGHGHLATVIRGCHPQAQDIGAQVIPHFLGSDHVADGLGHLAALLVHGETVGQHRLVGRRIADRQAGQQGRLEPATVLV